MPEVPSYHIAKSGVRAGKWVACPANQHCRNGGLHVPKTDMKAFKEEMKQTLGHAVTMDSITPEAAAFFMGKQEEKTEKADAQAVAAGVDLTGSRMNPELVSKSLKEINQATGKRTKTFEKAREQIIEQYEQVQNYPLISEFHKKIYKEFTGTDLKEAGSSYNHMQMAEVKKDNEGIYHFTVTDHYSAEDKEFYDDVVEKTKQTNEKVEPQYFTVTNWEDAEEEAYSSDEGWDSYDGYYGNPEVNFNVFRSYPLTDEQADEYKNSEKRTLLERHYRVAKEATLPAWALNKEMTPSNPSANNLAQLRRNNKNQQNLLENAVKTTKNAADRAGKLATQKTQLDKEIKQATEALKAEQPTVVKTALKEYLTAKKNELRVLEPKIERAAKKGADPKVTEAENKLQQFKTNSNSEQENKLWFEASKTWLANRFPSNNGTYRRSEAARWLNSHPETLETIKQELVRTNKV